MENIKKCPFCGNEANIWQNWNKKYGVYFVYVKCEMCNGQGRSFSSREEPAESDWTNDACERAVKAWNMEYKGER